MNWARRVPGLAAVGRIGLISAAWLLLGISRCVIAFVPYTRFADLLGQDLAVNPAVPSTTPSQTKWARRIRWALSVANRRTPWDSVCYPQALTAHVLLSAARVPHSTCFGVRRDADSDALKAHAWVAAGPVEVCGGDGFSDHATVRTYLWPRVPNAA